jgi:hypothetical protein
MRKTLLIVSVVGLLASVAQADLMIASFRCARDNFNVNYPGETLWNCGGTTNWRHNKAKQEGTYYADWAEQDLMELELLMSVPPPAPYTGYEVRYVVAPTGGTGVTRCYLETLNSETDWEENTANRVAGDGACNDFADQLVIPGLTQLPWIRTTDGAPVPFWDLVGIVNSDDYLDGGLGPWIFTIVPDWNNQADVDSMPQITLDLPVLQDLMYNPENRGLRAYNNWDAGADHNAPLAALGQWGGTGGARLVLYAVPEPASLTLIGLGGLGLLLRRRR